MRIPVRVWPTFLLLFFAAWCGREHAATNQSVVVVTSVNQLTTEKISLDFTPMKDPVSTYMTVNNDQAKVVRYSRSLLVVKSVAEGLLPRQDMSKLNDKTRAPAFANAVCSESFGAPGLARGDQFHLTINVEQKQKVCFGFIEDAPAAIRAVVEDLLSANPKLNPIELADAYLRSEAISPSRYAALRTSDRVQFLKLEELPKDVQQILSEAISKPRDFVVLTAEQRKNLQARNENKDFFITYRNSVHQLTLFLAQK